MSLLLGTNIGSYVTTHFGLVRTALGAGQGGNIGATDFTAFHRTAVRPLHLSAKVVVGVKAVLASGHTLAVTIQPKDSPDGSTYSNFGDAQVTTIHANDDGSALQQTVEMDVNLVGAAEYFRPTVTPVLSASGVDTAEVFSVLVLGGGETLPPTESVQ